MTAFLFGGADGGLEVRRKRDGSARISGRFPYGSTAVLGDGGRSGRPRKERFGPRAFAFRVDDPAEDIRLLIGHSFDKPLASKATGTLKLRDSDEALTFDAVIPAEVAATSYAADALALISAGLAVGLSPGFRMPPERAVPRGKAERITREPDNPSEGQNGAVIREVLDALLFELSIVTSAAYPEATVEQRNWTPDEYDAAQERGEVATGRDGPGAGVTDGNAKATTADIGLTRKDIHVAHLRRYRP